MSADSPSLPADCGHQQPPDVPEPPEPRTIRSEDLLCGDKEVVILHENQLYRLRRTRNGKLILQK
jgi:hemin uptake protein HemP